MNTISPYEIRQYIEQHNDNEILSLAEYWQRLGIGTGERRRFETCEVGLFELDLDRETGAEILLRLYDSSAGDTRYLIFKADSLSPQTEWKLLAYIDLDDQRYGLPQHRVIRSGEYNWLVLTALTGRGSGYNLYRHIWYETDERGAREVLSYPSSKFLAWMSTKPVLEARAKIMSATTDSDTTKVVIVFSASYLLYDDSQSDRKTRLWTRKQRGTFIRHAGAEEFKYDERESELSELELETIYDGEGPSCSDILRYNYKQLEEIVSGKDEFTKEWLRSYLGDCKDTPDKRDLLNALAQ